MEHRCPQCASSQVTCVREGGFAPECRCDGCGYVFTNPLLSVVFIDDNDARRQRLVTSLQREGIPVVAAGSVAELEGWPVGKVLVTHAASVAPFWFEMGAAHIVVLADSEEERALAATIAHERATVANGDPAVLLAKLRFIAESDAARAPVNGHQGERRSGVGERRRYPRHDRRS